MKKFLKDYFTFTKKERTAIWILLSLIAVSLLLPRLFPFFIHPKEYDHSAFQKQLSQLKIIEDSGENNPSHYDQSPGYRRYIPYEHKEFNNNNDRENLQATLFYFDPNAASVDDWKRLGIKSRTAEIIQKYISKGGRFYRPEDITKIWGISPQMAERLISYVKIENKFPGYEKKTFDKPVRKEAVNVDINASDTSAFIALPGIGGKLAQRIIAFRDKLGGFYSIDQVKETYGLPDSTFLKIRSKLVMSGSNVRKININTATIDEMRAHPYLRYNLSNAIIQYRTQHGNFTAVADIKKIMIITDEIFNRVAPYLTTE